MKNSLFNFALFTGCTAASVAIVAAVMYSQPGPDPINAQTEYDALVESVTTEDDITINHTVSPEFSNFIDEIVAEVMHDDVPYVYGIMRVPARRDNEATVLAAEIYRAPEEIKCLADNIYFEARSESIDGQEAVAWVTINRRDAGGFRNTICEVVKQKWRNDNGVYICQFSWYCDGKSDTPIDYAAYDIAEKLAEDLYYNFRKLDDPTVGSTYYHATYVSPAWRSMFERVAHIGKHVFYRDNRIVTMSTKG